MRLCRKCEADKATVADRISVPCGSLARCGLLTCEGAGLSQIVYETTPTLPILKCVTMAVYYVVCMFHAYTMHCRKCPLLPVLTYASLHRTFLPEPAALLMCRAAFVTDLNTLIKF
jgi:hypothetical protein